MKWTLVFSFFFFALGASAQQVDLDVYKGMNVRHIGPGTMSGRVTAIAVVREKPHIIFAGTASGGLWKSTSGGITWNPVFDEMPVQSIGAVAIAPSNSDIVWAGTGEGNPRNSHSSGRGIYMSRDGGITWKLMGLQETKTIHRIVVHPTNPDIVWAAAMGSIWGGNPDRGVYKTTDGGKTWNKVLFVNDRTGAADLIMDPSNPDKLFAAMWEYERKPWTFHSGGAGSGLYVTYDGGINWKEITEEQGLAEGPIGRIGIAISAADPNVVYALVESKKTALYRSNDGGRKFASVATENIGNRPFYYAEIYADPSDENTLYNLYSVLSKSIDGGKTFEVILPYYGVHPDHHAFYIHPDNPLYMINGNDGGLNISRDGGKNWEFAVNLPVGQFYHVNVDLQTPYRVYGGLQDNGSWVGPGYVWQEGGIRNENWQEILFGDGFDVVPDASDPDFAYAMYQGGHVYHVNIETGASRFIQPASTDSIPLRFNWNAAISADPHRSTGVYFGSQYVHYSADRGMSWKTLSPDLTTNDPDKQKQAESGGLTIDATQAENHTTVVCIAPGVINSKTIWTGSDDGLIHVTFDGGNTWTRVSDNIKGMPKGAYVNQIHPSHFNDKEAFVAVNNYRQNDWNTYVYHTTDGGKKWRRLNVVGVQGHAHTVVQDRHEEKLVFLGTEGGLFVSFDKGENWQQWKHQFPSVPVFDMKIHPVENDLVVATFGRGCYVIDNIEPLRQAAKNEQRFELFKANPAYLVDTKRPAGSRFPADYVWNGGNKSTAAILNYFMPPAMLDSTGKKEVKVSILSTSGDTLRVFTAKPDTGLNTIYWYYDTQGVRWPSRRPADKNKEPGGGPTVLPGFYTISLAYGDETCSGLLEVRQDPRNEVANDKLIAKQKFTQSVLALADTSGKAFDELQRAKQVIQLVQKQITMLNDTLYKPVSARADSLLKRIAELEGEFMLPEDFKGYNHVTKFLTDYLWDAMSHADNLGPNATEAYEKALTETNRVTSLVSEFFSNEWKAWEQLTSGYNWNVVTAGQKR